MQTDKLPSHGGDIYEVPVRYDFSANINPLGMHPAARQALADCAEAAEHYPDPLCRELTSAMAQREGAAPDKIACGNGAAELIYRIVQVMRPQRAILPVPSFGEYEKALRENTCEITFLPYPEADDFRLTDEMIRQLEKLLTGAYFANRKAAQSELSTILFLCTPNNPTGILPDAAALQRVRALCRERHILLVLDACFLDFTGVNQRDYIGELSENEILLKAFTKIYAMPGLRLGYCICGNACTARLLRESGPCWNVSVPAQLAGLAALREDEDYLERTRELVRQERQLLYEELTALGMRVNPSDANFLLWQGPKGLRERLLAQGISIRDCASFRGLERGWYRTAVRTHAENTALTETLKNCLPSGWKSK